MFSPQIYQGFLVQTKHVNCFPHIYRGFSFALAIFTVNSCPGCQPVHDAKSWQNCSKNMSHCVYVMSFNSVIYNSHFPCLVYEMMYVSVVWNCGVSIQSFVVLSIPKLPLGFFHIVYFVHYDYASSFICWFNSDVWVIL